MRKNWAAVATLAAVALCFAACGGAGSGGALSIDPVAKAATETAKLPSEKVSLHATIQAPGLSQALPFSAEGAVDNTARQGKMTLDMSAFARSVPSGPLADPTLWHGQEVFDTSHGIVIYMRLPFLNSLAHIDKPWVKLDLAAVGRQLGVDVGQFTQLGSGDPAQSLDYLRATSGKVTKVGTEQVRGVTTTHYAATVDLERYPNLVPSSKREAMRKSIEKLVELSGRKTIPVEVWVDGQKRVRRMKMAVPSKSARGTATTRMTMEFYDFGAPVSVQLPPASQTVDLQDVMKNAAGG